MVQRGTIRYLNTNFLNVLFKKTELVHVLFLLELSDTSVKYLIEALCRLSDESIELASSNREPSLFAVAKLLETALVNLGR